MKIPCPQGKSAHFRQTAQISSEIIVYLQWFKKNSLSLSAGNSVSLHREFIFACAGNPQGNPRARVLMNSRCWSSDSNGLKVVTGCGDQVRA